MNRKTMTISCIAVALGLCACEFASAQYVPGGGYVQPYRFRYPPYGGYGFYPSEIGTAYSANARGLADIIRAQGDYEIQHQQALSQAQENYFVRQQHYIQQRQAYAQRQAEKAAEVREANIARQRAYVDKHPQDQYGDELSPSEFNRQTGVAQWPGVFDSQIFAMSRAEADRQLKAWAAAEESKQPFDYYALDGAITDMRSQLQSLIRKLPTQQYLDARMYLDGLDTTVRTSQSAS